MIFGKNDLTIYDRYADEWWDPNSPRFRSLQRVTEFRLEVLKEWFSDVSGKRVVDIGCGGGLLSAPLAQRGASVIGLDISTSSLQTAQRATKGHSAYIAADARQLPLEDEYADFVLLADVLDHIREYAEVLSESRRILKPGGLLYVNTINRTLASWLLAIVLGEGSRLIPPGTHDHRLFIKPDELDSAADSAGLSVVAHQGEVPAIWRTMNDWAITFRASKSTSVAYSGLYQRTR